MTESSDGASSAPSPTGATYVEPSAETILKPGTKIGDLFRRNMTQPYVLQRLSERAWWVQAFNYGTVFYVGERGVLIFDTLEGVYDNITQAVASVTDKPIIAAVYPHYHADHIGDIGKYVEAARRQGIELQIIASAKTQQSMDLANSSLPATDAGPQLAARQLRLRRADGGAAWLRVGGAHRRPLRLASEAGAHHPLAGPDQP